MPISGPNLHERHFCEGLSNAGGEFWIAQQLGEDDRNHEHLPVFERLIKSIDIIAGGTLQKSDPRTCVRRNHLFLQRSAFSSVNLREKRTFPRNRLSVA